MLARRVFLASLALSLLLPGRPALAAQRGPLVLAAASLQEAMTAAARAWAAKGHPRPVLSFAASSALARQIAAGAPADLFVSADEAWMDTLQRKGLLRKGTRATLAGNRLVLIAPARSTVRLRIAPGFRLDKALGKGRLAMANPDAVPAGRYGKQTLVALKAWNGVRRRIAPVENVRVALAYVSRGESPLGIVYATDAKAERRVRVVGTFPASSHAPIRYPVAVLHRSRNAGAEAFRRFLLSREGRAIFARHGFSAR